MVNKNYFICAEILCLFMTLVLFIQCDDQQDYSNLRGDWAFKMENIELGYWPHSGESLINGSFTIHSQSKETFTGTGVLEYDFQTDLVFEINGEIDTNDKITMQWTIEDAFNSEQACIWELIDFTLSDNTIHGSSNIECVLQGGAGITATKK
jgi:hypothetical protein